MSMVPMTKDEAIVRVRELLREVGELRKFIGGSEQPWGWYVYDPEEGIDRYQTEAEAQARAEEIMGEESDRAASDGWRDDIDTLQWGQLITYQSAACVKSEEAPDGSEWDEIQEWALR